MDFELPVELTQRLTELDDFIEREIRPLQEQDDNERFFDHRREYSRTDFENGGVPRREWEELLGEMFRRADAAGWLRYGLPKAVGGSDGSNLDMAVIREHLARKGLGLHNDLQNEASIVGNFPFVHMMLEYGTTAQKEEFLEPMLNRTKRIGFGLTEPDHGSDATWMETTAVRDGDDWILNGAKRFNSGMHSATHDVVFARTSGKPGDARGITAFFTPTDSPGFSVDFHWWTFNMPTDHAEVTIRDVRVPHSAIFGEEGEGLAVAQTFVHQNRIRQAASGVGAGQYCIDRSVAYARERVTFGQPLATRQGIQWPLVELQTEAAMVRALVRQTAWEMDQGDPAAVSDRVSMCNYRANRLACDAADRAMQVFGGAGLCQDTPLARMYAETRIVRIADGPDEVHRRALARTELRRFEAATTPAPRGATSHLAL